MSVQELIDKLREMNPKARVIVWNITPQDYWLQDEAPIVSDDEDGLTVTIEAGSTD